MITRDQSTLSMVGAVWALGATFAFSINDVLVKLMSGDYPLHEIVFVRSMVGMVIILVFFLPFAGGLSSVRTRRPVAHVLRGLCIVMANICFYLGLAAMPLAEAVAVFFTAPMVISAASVIFLRETVGPRRWLAIIGGFIGVVIVLRPGTEAFQPAAFLPLIAAFWYAALHIMTRKFGLSESAISLVFYPHLVFIVTSAMIGVALGHGGFSGSGGASLEFLLRMWTWPTPIDWVYMVVIGVGTAIGGYSIGQAYRNSEAALVAPFEYAAIPLSVIWGYAIFSESPDAVALTGMVLILASGLFLVWREAMVRRTVASRPPAQR